MSDRIALFDRTMNYLYRTAELREFEQDLRQIDKHTLIHTINRPDELRLDYRGRTLAHEHQYLFPGFAEICARLAKGLVTTLASLSGTRNYGLEELDIIDGRAAIDFFNKVVGIRYRLVSGRRLVLDQQARTIDGVISASRPVLTNLAYYNQVNSHFRQHDCGLQWHAGQLAGRRLNLWYRHEKPCCHLNLGDFTWPVHHGYYLSNGEISGMGISATHAFYLPCGVVLAHFKPYGKTLHHRGRDLEVRVGSFLQTMLLDKRAVDEVVAKAPGCITRPLGWLADMEMKPAEELRVKWCRRMSRKLRINTEAADKLIQLTLLFGRTSRTSNIGEYELPAGGLAKLGASRTLVDMLVALLVWAKRCGWSTRERYEQVAYDMLINNY